MCALKKFYLIAPFFLFLLLTSPMPAFSLGFLGGNDEHINFFLTLVILFSKRHSISTRIWIQVKHLPILNLIPPPYLTHPNQPKPYLCTVYIV